MIPFNLTGEYIELRQLLKAAGLAETGGQAGQAIMAGMVKVDGKVEKRKGCKLRPGMVVEYQGQQVRIEQ